MSNNWWMKNGRHLICAGCGCCCLITMIITGLIIFFNSYVQVDPLEMALKKDDYTNLVNGKEILLNGRIYTGYGYSLIKYPNKIEKVIFSNIVQKEKSAISDELATIDNSIVARTNSGLIITVDLYLAYKITTSQDLNVKAKQLYDIYLKFGHDYENFITFIVESEVRDYFATLNGEDFWQDRQQLGQQLFTRINNYLQEYNFKLILCNILNFAFDKSYERINTDTEVIHQQILERTEYKKKVEIDNEIALQQANFYKNSTQKKTTYDVNIIDKDNYYKNQAIRDSINNEKAALQSIEGQFTRANINTFLWIYLLKHSQTNKITLESKSPTGIKSI